MINKTSRLFKRTKITILAAACFYICHTGHLISMNHVITRALLTQSHPKRQQNSYRLCSDVLLREGTSIILLLPSTLRTWRMKEKHADLSER